MIPENNFINFIPNIGITYSLTYIPGNPRLIHIPNTPLFKNVEVVKSDLMLHRLIKIVVKHNLLEVVEIQ